MKLPIHLNRLNRSVASGLCAWLAIAPIIGVTRAQAARPAQDTVQVNAETERVIHGGLLYLASQQAPNGSFVRDAHQAALTAYALIAFMSAGQIPGEGEFGKSVTSGLQFLLDCSRPDGYIAAPTGENNMYGHGISTIALAEMYGQTSSTAIRPKLARAVKLIVDCQNSQGGWRYPPRVGDADLSVTVLQVVALRAAKNSGIDVPQTTIDKAVAYVKSCQDGGGFDYQPGSSQPGFARTAAALYSLQVCGLYDDPLVRSGSQYLFANADSDQQWFTYGNFYAAPAQYMIGGDVWKQWYTNVHDQLMQAVQRRPDGSCYWNPVEGSRGVNEIYATSVYTMILAMPYHYIPLYQR